MVRLVSMFFLVTVIHGAYSQEPCKSISGKVLDISNKEPLPFVNIRIVETNTGTISKEDGTFEILNVCEEEVHLTFSYVGYKTVEHHHDLHHQIPTIYMASTEIALEGIVVEGKRESTLLKTLKTDEIKLKDISQFGRVDFSTVGRSISGLSMISTGQNIQKPVINGLYGNRILIINNGIRHEYQSWGADHAPEIDPSMASSIEVVKGAATVKYGPDALGGVLIINPPSLDLHQEFTGSAQLTGKTNGQSGDGEIRLQKGFEHWALMLEGAGVIQGDLKAPQFNLTNTGKKELSLAGGARYHKANYDLYTYVSHFEQNLGILRGSVTGNLDDLIRAMSLDVPAYTGEFSYGIGSPRQNSVHDLAKLQLKVFGEDQEFDFTYGFQSNQRKEFDVRRGTNNDVPSINLQLMTQTVDFHWKHDKWGNLDSDVGLSWIYQDNNNLPGTNTAAFLPNYNHTRIGFYAVESLQKGKTLWEMGIRYDFQYTSIRGHYPNNDIYRNELNYNNLTASLGFQHDFGNHIKWMSHLGSAWRPPGISELYSFGKHQSSLEYGLWRYLENGDNAPDTGVLLTQNEKLVKNEVGWKWVNNLDVEIGESDWSLTAYFNYIENYLYATPRGITNTIRGAFPYYVYRQTNAVLTGVDLSASFNWTSKWQSTLKGGYVYARDIQFGNYFVGIPPLDLQSGITYQMETGKVNHLFKLDISYVFRQFLSPRVIPPEDILNAMNEEGNLFGSEAEIFDIQEAPDGYFLTDIGWNGSWNQWELAVMARNLLNSTYRNYTDRIRYFAPEMGRNISLTLKWTF